MLFVFYSIDPGFWNASHHFSNKIEQDDHDPNRFRLTLELEQADVSDMGKYELRIYDKLDGEDKSVFQPTLPMFLYVKAKPDVTFQGGTENSHGFYHQGEHIGLTCNIKSYPIKETR